MGSIIISTESTLHNEWIAFACWYSIHRNAPHLAVELSLPRESKVFQYTWARKCKVKISTYPADHPPQFSDVDKVIPDHVMMVRSDGDYLKWTAATDSEPAAMVDISTVGKFNLQDWTKNEKTHPFHKAGGFLGRQRTVNEVRVITLWRQMAQTFDFINRP